MSNFDKNYNDTLFLEWCMNDVDMFKYLRGYDFSLDRFKKAK